MSGATWFRVGDKHILWFTDMTYESMDSLRNWLREHELKDVLLMGGQPLTLFDIEPEEVPPLVQEWLESHA